ncbi:UV DNA damage repair endonuclease UvsE [Clostridium tagluense]|uniref:UV DNA damage repair endonuclease UvsE n=1 Tax=Clostridium tagluense TaxID=360422 RepID=UPI001C0A9899|nr:UV DNA damage repair endonuclease UvsE [Clostridium tagluense]MBU3126447.1 UV DNA damage repair endonuclease UvsE [Clostridium tagluense]MCB2309816.1 UV DNA damage repair endonuclease UvsE [Clostridium tagluense]MCB2314654.1 UV DNA damage repair endonuclease UvsE [Clostridium tagluense]MCB2319502.1 UV DNA damage repair endonuclease UvsE [Clostridium tagluense]MCB2324410.1 UV DNA damage repair endonuclease UvsE [Clostridium tagluense]
MKIGYACIPLTIDARTNRRLTLKNFSEKMLLEVLEQNLIDLRQILENNEKYNIKLFRISSDIVPLGSHSINEIPWHKYFQNELNEIGEYIKKCGMRVSMHPGQYTVLNAEKEDIVEKAIKDLEYHARFLDALGVDGENKIILHIGGGYGDKVSAMNRFIENFKRLSLSVKNRLVIENDDRTFNINDLLFVSAEINIPVIFDNLHHECNHEMEIPIKEIMNRVAKTWKEEDGNPKVHYSQQDLRKHVGAHSNTIIIKDFLEYYEEVKEFNIDIMLEVKDKDVSAIKCNLVVSNMNKKLKHVITEKQWAKYKYLLMERNYKYYKECSRLVKENCNIQQFYEYTDEVMNFPVENGSFINTCEHVWGYVKSSASDKEHAHFRKLLMDLEHKEKVKIYLKKLCDKYNAEYMLNSYYFHY